MTKLRRPCENCPWRVDAPRQHWDPSHFVEIWKNCQDDGLHGMLCHKTRDATDPEARIPCQGWVRVMGASAIGVRIMLLRGTVTTAELDDRDGPELFKTFAAMLRANRITLPERTNRRKDLR